MGTVPFFFIFLDMRSGASYDAPVMDSRTDLSLAAAALSSRLWNWWAAPTAR